MQHARFVTSASTWPRKANGCGSVIPEAGSDESARKTRVVGERSVSAPDPDLPRSLRSLVRSGFQSHRGQGLIEVSDQIFAILDANGQSDEIVRDTQRFTLRFGNRSMRHDGGMIDQRLDAAE